MSDRQKRCADLARQWLDADPLILDTETTGLGDDAEIVEITAIDRKGRAVIDTLIRPTRPIPRAAVDIHGITNAAVAAAPRWQDVHDTVCLALRRRPVIIYNASYDARLIRQTATLAGIQDWGEGWFQPWCAMELYAEFIGEPNTRPGRGPWRWHKLVDAAQHCGVVTEGSHRARADCLMTLGVLERMAKQ